MKGKLILSALAALLALGISAQQTSAELFGGGKREGFSSQTRVLDTRAKTQYSASIRLQPPKVKTPSKWDDEVKPFRGAYRGPYLQMAKSAAMRHGIPTDLFLRLVQQESGWRVNAKSHKGALGLAQLMPGTARKLRVNPHDPYENLEGGARYLKMQYETFRSWRLALAAYNAGPGAVKKYGGVPPFKETRNYVKVIWGS
ncbi:lytic transglycosylase domain-containing protein [Rhodobacteraceae bacterium 63075]|nr:lytic transglycosylase domain-containing protein [Rhodobacteraceae bacterium 63075]